MMNGVNLHGNNPCCETMNDRPMSDYVGECESSGEPVPTVSTKAREIHIESLDHGYVVRVGCQRFSIEDSDKMLKYLKIYLEDPQFIEQSWLNKELKLV